MNIEIVNDRSILDTVKRICLSTISNEDFTIDMTVGNGLDTLFLAKNSKFVFGFDIQEKALDNTKKLLEENNLSNYKLFLCSHEFVKEHVLEKPKLIIFNLGYLPGGNKCITTKTSSTMKALINSLDILEDDGRILIVCYSHEEGKKESKSIIDYLENNRIYFKIYKNGDNEYAPFLIEIKN